MIFSDWMVYAVEQTRLTPIQWLSLPPWLQQEHPSSSSSSESAHLRDSGHVFCFHFFHLWHGWKTPHPSIWKAEFMIQKKTKETVWSHPNPLDPKAIPLPSILGGGGEGWWERVNVYKIDSKDMSRISKWQNGIDKCIWNLSVFLILELYHWTCKEE